MQYQTPMKSLLAHACQSLALTLLAIVGAGALAQAVPTLTLTPRVGVGVTTIEGGVQAAQQSTISAQVQGRVLSMRVKAGDAVKAGQLLATIDDRETAATGERSQAQLQQAEAELRTMQVQLERTRDLQQKGFVSKAALDTATLQLQSAQAGRDQARAATKLSALSQGYTRVTAPYDGWVLQTHVLSGDLAAAGTPLVTVYAPTPLRVVAHVPTSLSQDLRTATTTRIALPSVAGASRSIAPGKPQIVPSTDVVSQTNEWRWDLTAKDAMGLTPGQSVLVTFEVAAPTQRSQLIVPAGAVVRRGEMTGVYVQAETGFSLRAVRVAATGVDGSVEVIAGLRAGESIALDPLKAAAAAKK